ncbi:MAG: FmdB family transcriptional regulator [Acidimicrobiales bacterium]|nr:FmdB family transcriptional regulator [Acidimicrobiales bacterium]
MPTYEYHCDSCDQNFDVVQSFQDDPLTVCPTCGSPVRKVFGNVGIVFKGSGFYKNDSRQKTPTKAAAGESSTTPTTGSESPGGSDGSESSSDGKKAPATGESLPSKPETPAKKPDPVASSTSGSSKPSDSGSSTP